jgi:uncharacterized protein (DUF1697 family)
MADLRALLTGLGYTNVKTHLQSGNAVFASSARSPDQVAAQIENGIAKGLGMTVRCLVRSGDELRTVLDGNPFTAEADNGSKMMALFLSDLPDPALVKAHDPTSLAPEEIQLGDRVIYQWCPQGLMAAPAASVFVEKYLGVAVTARNWNTVTKLAALIDG